MLLRVSRSVVIYGTLLIWLIKFFIRPFFDLDAPTRFFFNIAPNLFGSFVIPFAAFWFFTGRNHFIARVFRINTIYDLRVVCMLGFGMLVVNEYLQKISFFGRTFDYNDIVFSSVGLIAACYIFGKLQARQQWIDLKTDQLL